jgi:hypothetical protein
MPSIAAGTPTELRHRFHTTETERSPDLYFDQAWRRPFTGYCRRVEDITLPANGHTSFNLTDRYASATAKRRGTLEFRTPSAGQIGVLGLRFNAQGAFSTIPPLVKWQPGHARWRIAGPGTEQLVS